MSAFGTMNTSGYSGGTSREEGGGSSRSPNASHTEPRTDAERSFRSKGTARTVVLTALLGYLGGEGVPSTVRLKQP
jgi:hypothetical protein